MKSRLQGGNRNARPIAYPGDARSIGWRAILIAAPLVYGAGVLAGDLLGVVFGGASAGVLASGVVVLLVCAVASLGLARVIDRITRPESRSLRARLAPQASMRVGAAVLVPAFLLGVCFATLA